MRAFDVALGLCLGFSGGPAKRAERNQDTKRGANSAGKIVGRCRQTVRRRGPTDGQRSAFCRQFGNGSYELPKLRRDAFCAVNVSRRISKTTTSRWRFVSRLWRDLNNFRRNVSTSLGQICGGFGARVSNTKSHCSKSNRSSQFVHYASRLTSSLGAARRRVSGETDRERL